MTAAKTQIIIRCQWNGRWLVDPALRERLIETAAEKESNLTDVIVEILAGKFGVEYDGPGRRSTPDPKARDITVRLPPTLFAALERRATRRVSVQDLIRAALSEHYELALPSAA